MFQQSWTSWFILNGTLLLSLTEVKSVQETLLLGSTGEEEETVHYITYITSAFNPSLRSSRRPACCTWAAGLGSVSCSRIVGNEPLTWSYNLDMRYKFFITEDFIRCVRIRSGFHITLCLNILTNVHTPYVWRFSLTLYGLGMWWFVPQISQWGDGRSREWGACTIQCSVPEWWCGQCHVSSRPSVQLRNSEVGDPNLTHFITHI